jgi:hypothetical protein
VRTFAGADEQYAELARSATPKEKLQDEMDGFACSKGASFLDSILVEIKSGIEEALIRAAGEDDAGTSD